MRRKDREVSNTEEIKHIIEKCKVCHLAMVDRGQPYVVPLNFGYIIDENSLTLFFHSAKTGRKIDILSENNAVCFEMAFEGKLGYIEDPCNSGYYFESVQGFGHVEFIEDINEKCNALTLERLINNTIDLVVLTKLFSTGYFLIQQVNCTK
ncbi:MAG: pyridoxamine 5'-phosphate oxidase family protein [Ruminiclostridium sp.]